jgi:Tol biopolymer transport system component
MPTATPLAQPTGLLPGKVIYATGGTFDEMDRSGHVTDIMPSWMTAAAMPAIAPDGRNLAFVRWSAEASDIGTYDLRTHAAPTQITKDLSPDPTFISNSLWAAWPSWSADGKTLLFASDAYKLQAAANESRMLDLAIYRISRDGSNLQQLTTPASGAGGDTDPQFRGRTSEFLYDHWAYTWHGGVAVGQPHSQLMIRNADNPHASWTLTPPSDQIVQPALDRSGTHVAYIHSGSVSSTLITGRIVDSRRGPVLRDRRVVARGKIAQPAFTPDGRWVSYLQADGSGFSLYLVPVRGGQAFKVAAAGSGLDATSRPVWVQ